MAYREEQDISIEYGKIGSLIANSLPKKRAL